MKNYDEMDMRQTSIIFIEDKEDTQNNFLFFRFLFYI